MVLLLSKYLFFGKHFILFWEKEIEKHVTSKFNLQIGVAKNTLFNLFLNPKNELLNTF